MKMKVKKVEEYKNTIGLVTKYGTLYLPTKRPEFYRDILSRARLWKFVYTEDGVHLDWATGHYLHATIVHNSCPDLSHNLLAAGD